MSDDALVGLLTLINTPALYLGFFPPKNGQSAGKQALNFMSSFLTPQKRPFVDLPVFWHVREEIIAGGLEVRRACKKMKRGKRK
jgi:hypothetical protein